MESLNNQFLYIKKILFEKYWGRKYCFVDNDMLKNLPFYFCKNYNYIISIGPM